MEQFGQLESSILVLGLEDSGQKRSWKVESEERRWKPSGEDHRNTRTKKGVRPYTKTPAETPNLRSKQMGKVYHLPIPGISKEASSTKSILYIRLCKRFGGEWIHVYPWLSPSAVPLKLSQTPLQKGRLQPQARDKHRSGGPRAPCACAWLAATRTTRSTYAHLCSAHTMLSCCTDSCSEGRATSNLSLCS